MFRFKISSFPRPGRSELPPYAQGNPLIQSALYAEVLSQTPAKTTLLIGPTASDLIKNQNLQGSTIVVDGLDQIENLNLDLDNNSPVYLANSLNGIGVHETVITLDTPLICPSPIEKISDIPHRLQEISDCLEIGGTWWLVIANSVHQRITGNEQVRFTSSLRELPGTAIDTFSTVQNSLTTDLVAIFGSSYSIEEIWEIEGPFSNPTELRNLSVTRAIGISKDDIRSSQNIKTSEGQLESLRLRVLLGPNEDLAINSGWLVRLSKTSEVRIADQIPQLAKRTLASELHALLFGEQLLEAGKVLEQYQRKVLSPSFSTSVKTTLTHSKVTFEQKQAIALEAGSGNSTQLMSTIESFIQVDAFQQCAISGDYDDLKIVRSWPSGKQLTPASESNFNLETYLAAELLFFVSQWLYPSPPQWLSNSLAPSELISHLIGLADLDQAVIEWETIERMRTGLPHILQVPMHIPTNGIQDDFSWGVNDESVDFNEVLRLRRLVSDQHRLVKRWRKRLIVTRAKNFGFDEARLVKMYRAIISPTKDRNR